MDERRAKLSVNQTEMISKRVAANRNKVHQNKGVPGLEAEVEKLEESIRAVSLKKGCLCAEYTNNRAYMGSRMKWN